MANERCSINCTFISAGVPGHRARVMLLLSNAAADESWMMKPLDWLLLGLLRWIRQVWKPVNAGFGATFECE